MNSQFEKEMESLGVTPLGKSSKAKLETIKPKPNNDNSTKADKQVLAESLSVNPTTSQHAVESDEELRKSGLSIRDFSRLKQGKYCREKELYLRGYTVEEAIAQLKQFIDQSVWAGFRCIKIVHGKGMNSPNGISLIKLECQRVLTLNRFVMGYTRALPNDGGTGAKYVLLKKRKS